MILFMKLAYQLYLYKICIYEITGLFTMILSSKLHLSILKYINLLA